MYKIIYICTIYLGTYLNSVLLVVFVVSESTKKSQWFANKLTTDLNLTAWVEYLLQNKNHELDFL